MILYLLIPCTYSHISQKIQLTCLRNLTIVIFTLSWYCSCALTLSYLFACYSKPFAINLQLVVTCGRHFLQYYIYISEESQHYS